MTDKLAYTVNEAAKLVSLSPRTLYELIYLGQIEAFRVKARGHKGKGKILVPRASLEAWIQASTARSAS